MQAHISVFNFNIFRILHIDLGGICTKTEFFLHEFESILANGDFSNEKPNTRGSINENNKYTLF